MKYVDWDEAKNEILKRERDISFEKVVLAIIDGSTLDGYDHPNQKLYPKQKIFVVNIDNYAYFVPYVEDQDKFFLKTIIPSRKATKKYLIKNKSITSGK